MLGGVLSGQEQQVKNAGVNATVIENSKCTLPSSVVLGGGSQFNISISDVGAMKFTAVNDCSALKQSPISKTFSKPEAIAICLNEFTDIMTMQQIGESRKPIFFMNTANFWGAFSQLFLSMQANGFIENVDDYHIHVANTPDELFQQILNYDK